MKKTTASFLMGLLAGAAAGAIAGILFAPDKGSKTRENLRNKLIDLSDEYGLGLSEIIEKAEETLKKEVKKPGTKQQPPERKKRKYSRKPNAARE